MALEVRPPPDVAKFAKRPPHAPEPVQLPYIGGQVNPTESCTGWTVPRVRLAIEAHDAGNFQQTGLLMEAMLQDDAVYHGYHQRVSGVDTLPQRFVPSKKRGGKRAARIWAKYQRLIFPSGRRELWRYLYFHGFCLCSIQWIKVPNVDGDGPPFWTIPQFKAWHPFFLNFIPTFQPDEYAGFGGDQAGGYFQVITYNQATLRLVNELAPGNGQWVMFTVGGARPWYDGIVRPLWSPWLRRVYTRRDHARFEEKHGLPVTVIKFPTYMGGENKDFMSFQRDEFLRQGSEGLFFAPQDVTNPNAGMDIELKGPPNAAAVTSFVESKKEEDNDIYTLWLGQSLTTAAGENGGSHAAVLGMERRIDQLKREDAMWVSDAQIEWFDTVDGDRRWHMVPSDGPIREQVGKFFAYYNFGDPELAPYDFVDATPQEDRVRAAELMGKRALSWWHVGHAVDFLTSKRAKEGLEPYPIDERKVLHSVGMPITGDEDEGADTPGLEILKHGKRPRLKVIR